MFADADTRPQWVHARRFVGFSKLLCESAHLRFTLRAVQTFSEADDTEEHRYCYDQRWLNFACTDHIYKLQHLTNTCCHWLWFTDHTYAVEAANEPHKGERAVNLQGGPAIRVKSTHFIISFFENQNKKRKYGNKSFFYTNLHLKSRLDIEFTLATASWCRRKRWYHLPYMTHIGSLRVSHSYWDQKVGHA